MGTQYFIYFCFKFFLISAFLSYNSKVRNTGLLGPFQSKGICLIADNHGYFQWQHTFGNLIHDCLQVTAAATDQYANLMVIHQTRRPSE